MYVDPTLVKTIAVKVPIVVSTVEIEELAFAL